MIWIFVGLIVFTGLMMAGAAQFTANSAQRKQIVVGTLEGTVSTEAPGTRFARASLLFNRTRLGRWLHRPRGSPRRSGR
jgi:hypothetical protein